MAIFERVLQQTFSPETGVTDYYWIVGDERNPTLVIIPGFTGSHGDLLAITETLREKYFVIIPDMPGWGKSEPLREKLTIERYAKYLKQLLDHRQIKRATMLGHCMGALVAFEFAYRYPEMADTVFAISTPYMEGTLSFRIIKFLMETAARSPRPFRPIFFFWRARVFAIPAGFFIMKFRSFRTILRRSYTAVFFQSGENEDAVEENLISTYRFNFGKVRRIRSSVHFIHGEKDRIISPTQVLKLSVSLKSATYDIIPQAGHLPPLETPGSVETLIRQYST